MKVPVTFTTPRRLRSFSRVERVFYGSLVITGTILAIAIIFTQVKIMGVRQEITSLNQELTKKEDDEREQKDTINEMTSYAKCLEIIAKEGLEFIPDNIENIN